jgi:hypothetical protein
MAISISKAQVLRQLAGPESVDFANAVVSVSRGQTLRVSVINSLPPARPNEDGRKFKMLLAPLILDATGRVLASSDEIALNPGEFHAFNFTFNFNSADLPQLDDVPVQLRCEVRRRMFPGFVGGVSVASADLDGVVEIIDNLTGQTQATALLRQDVELKSPGTQFQTISIVGLAMGQSLRVNVAHPDEGRSSSLLRARIVLNDGSGKLIAQSPELMIPSEEFRSYDFPRSALPLSGEPGTGRLQMAANVFLKFDSGKLDRASVSLELVDQTTGRTIGLPVPAVQKVKVINNCPDCEFPRQ